MCAGSCQHRRFNTSYSDEHETEADHLKLRSQSICSSLALIFLGILFLLVQLVGYVLHMLPCYSRLFHLPD